MSEQVTESARARELDGIRGWAALSVVLFHLLCVVFGEQLPGIRGNALLFAALNGPLAVFVFFILSGDALSIGYLRTGDPRVIDSLLIRRYFRLMIPVALSTLLIFALMRFGLVFNKEAGGVARMYGWLEGALNFVPTWNNFLRYVLIEVFSPTYAYGWPMAIYNPMLWTMAVELAGSVLIFVFWYVSPAIRHPRYVLLALIAALMLLGSLYALFFFGVLLAMLRHDGVAERWRANLVWQIAAPLVAIAAAVAHATLEEQSKVYRYASLACSMILVTCFYTSRPALAFFRSRLSRFLGEISFPLYLTHFAVIVSLTSWLILRNQPLDRVDALGISALSTVAALLVASIFRVVERGTLRIVDRRLLRLFSRTGGSGRSG